MMNISWVKNLPKPVAIIGLGKSGLAALEFLKTIGFTESDLVTYDAKDPSAQVSQHHALTALKPKTIVVSPGVPLQSDWIQKLITEGAFLTSEIALAASVLTTEKVIGVTGSVGKSTVTSLLGEGAQTIDPYCFVGGNLGLPFCEYATRILRDGPKAEWVVLELSSYQLENFGPLKLDYSAITFLSANHLERYKNLEEYYKTKMKITEITKDVCVFNQNSSDAVEYSKKSSCQVLLTDRQHFSDKQLLSEVALIGAHNKDNFCVAAEIAKLCGWSYQSFKAMAQYRGLRHRLEFVAEVRGVKYVNDSKATAMDSVLVAVKGCLEKVAPNRKLYLLLGGKDKNLPWEKLNTLEQDNNISFVFFGLCGSLAQSKSKLSGPCYDSLGSAIEYCQSQATSGDTVLLSPGGTSLDQFKNFEERGDFFKRLVLAGAEA